MGRSSRSPFARREALREPYDRVLIVCEGDKTEPNYFRDLIAVHRLSSSNISIVSPGADPVTVVDHARKKLGDFDRVFCVYDGENVDRATQANALIAQSAQGRSGKWSPVVSFPCFEVWLHLHFKYSTAPYSSGGGKTIGQAVEAGLRSHLPSYSKGATGLYSRLLDKVTIAMANGRRLEKYNRSTQSNNPATQMHELVDYLRSLKRV